MYEKIFKNKETIMEKKPLTVKTESTKNTIEFLKNPICDN